MNVVDLLFGDLASLSIECNYRCHCCPYVRDLSSIISRPSQKRLHVDDHFTNYRRHSLPSPVIFIT